MTKEQAHQRHIFLIGLTVLIGIGWNADLPQRYRKHRVEVERKAREAQWKREEQEIALWPIYRVMCAHDSWAEICAAISNCPPKHWVIIGEGEWKVAEFAPYSIPPQTGVKGVNAKFSNYDTNGFGSSITLGTIWRYGK